MKKLSFFVIISVLLISCGIFKKKYTPDRQNIRFMNYLKSQGIDPDTVKVFSRYYDDHFLYRQEQKRQALLKNPYLRINEVYVDYGITSVDLYVFSDNEVSYVEELKITDPTKAEVVDNKKVILKQPVVATRFRSFDLIENKLYTNSWEKKTPWSKEQKWIWTFIAKKDTLQLLELYRAKNDYLSLKKQFLAKRRKLSDYLIYQPNLKAQKGFIWIGLDKYDAFSITGEFDLDKPWDAL